MRFRQIHLDFHTSAAIPRIGEKFDRRRFQETLRRAAVNSVTLFATCHHGYAYYDTKIHHRHPQLSFDLLRAEVDACQEIGIATPIYLTAGYNNLLSEEHPEFCQMDAEGRLYDPLKPHFHRMCFNTPYLDFLCRQIREVIELFPEASGIFTDIIYQGPCCCPACIASMRRRGLDPADPEARRRHARLVLLEYYRRSSETVHETAPGLPIFHNSGHITVGDREVLPFFSHLELESLPTGGWGYDHFPLSAAYCRNLGLEFLGMTGKFHSTWGEFGGFKQVEALRYECAAMIANGAKCSIGDQLHPSGALDESTYEIIGEVYRAVEACEPWCIRAVSYAETAILSGSQPGVAAGRRELPGDSGAARILLEAHIPFDVVDAEMDFSRYRLLILSDDLRLTPELAAKLEAFRTAGGKLVLAGESDAAPDGRSFLTGLPFADCGRSPWQPDFVRAAPELAPKHLHTPFVMELPSRRIRRTRGRSLGEVFDPYFNRTAEHFCSHQHTPFRPDPSGYDAGVLDDGLLYFAHPVFSIYRAYGNVAVRQFIVNALRALLGNALQLDSSLPSQGRVTLMRQPEKQRSILHLLFAEKILRGGTIELADGTTAGRSGQEVIEELNPIGPVRVSLKLPHPVGSVRLVPKEEEIPFTKRDDRIEFTVPEFCCHQMIELADRKR